MSDPSQFYTGLVADLYNPLRGHAPDPGIYAAFVRRSGEPALELGCGDGDPLLALRAEGLDVEGLDSSADMLERCRARAAEAGVEVVLHHQAIESMSLARRYRTIFLAGPTFNLLIGDDVVVAALERIRDHLEQGGSALIPLFTPEPAPPELLGQWKEQTLDDGTLIRVAAAASEASGREVTTVLRYERTRPGATTEVLERPWRLFVHDQAGFRTLALEAGLEVSAVLGGDGAPAGPEATTFVFVLGRTDEADGSGSPRPAHDDGRGRVHTDPVRS